MSWAATAFVKKLTHKPDGTPITRSEKMLLIMLSDYYNDEEDMAWPSIPELSKQALISQRQAQRLLHFLAKKKVIKLILRQRRNGGTSSNGYRLLGLRDTPPGDMVAPPDTMTPHDITSPGDTMMSPPGDMVAPALSLNQSIEPLVETHPPIVPKGDGVSRKHGTRRKDVKPLTPDEQTVLAHLNARTGRNYRVPGEIAGCLARGATVQECMLVIDWWAEVRIKRNPDQDEYFDNTTPFRESNFGKYLPAAESWDKQGRPQYYTNGTTHHPTHAAITNFVERVKHEAR